ncbi:hypothetical protein CCR75_008684 [Bremia lactucae]|uniref:Uncharacterized protein n=1 Tax=Bremia lactucae TaxID=4779 RepID=A0A976ICW6_BRELC|nr:hypothetical protein CCR75_008684 [Bremia lactucae]
MGNFLVSSVCHAHGRSEAVYAIMKDNVLALRDSQSRYSPLRRQCAVHQAALLRVISAKLALYIVTIERWAATASRRAMATLKKPFVLFAQQLVVGTIPQLPLPQAEYDDVFCEFDAVFETTPHSSKTLRELQQSSKLMTTGSGKDPLQRQAEVEQSETLKDGEHSSSDDTDDEKQASDLDNADDTKQASNLDDEYVVLPALENNREFYIELLDTQAGSEGISDSSIHFEKFIICGKHDKFEKISKDVDVYASKASNSAKRSIVRVLLAYCAHKNDSKYTSDMVLTAENCLKVWHGDEDRAFKSLVAL